MVPMIKLIIIIIIIIEENIMSRSVSVPKEAVLVVYESLDEYLDESLDESLWEFYIEDLEARALSLWPSLTKCDIWLGNEDHALLENDLAFFGVSQYGDLVSIWMVPKDSWDSFPQLAENWLNRIEANFNKEFGTYEKIGSFSNGECLFSAK